MTKKITPGHPNDQVQQYNRSDTSDSDLCLLNKFLRCRRRESNKVGSRRPSGAGAAPLETKPPYGLVYRSGRADYLDPGDRCSTR